VLELVRGLAAEVHPHASGAAVTLDSELERELGLGSLELAVLLVRVEGVFGVRLSSETLGAAQTPADLLREVRAAPRRLADRVGLTPVGGQRSGPRAGLVVPGTASTLADVLRRQGEAAPDRIHVRVLGEAGVEDELSTIWG
jgi:acyl carrier protein